MKHGKIKKADEVKLNKAIDMINETIESIRKYHPEANIFVAGEGTTSLNIHTKPYTGCEIKESLEWQYSSAYNKEMYYADCGGY